MSPRLVLAGLLVVGGLGVFPAAGQNAEPGRKMPDLGQQHVADGTPITYPEYPPPPGPHRPHWPPWVVSPTRVPEEMFVHNLEHGGIAILYKCPSPCPDITRQLEATFRTLPPSKYGHVKVVISPNDRIKTRFALLAWTRLDEFERFDQDRILRFVRAYQDKGPEDVP